MSARLCPICKARPVPSAVEIFCSDRCKIIDLGRWLDGAYVIPGADHSIDPDEFDAAIEADSANETTMNERKKDEK